MRGHPVFKRVSGFSEPVIGKSQEVFLQLEMQVFYIPASFTLLYIPFSDMLEIGNFLSVS